MFKRLLCATLALGLVLTSLRGASDEEPVNLSVRKQEMKTYVDSGAYARGVAAVALAANKFLNKRIPRGAKPGQKLAVVFDIDETTLTNLPHIQSNDYGYVPVVWDKWVAAGQARAIFPVQTVYDTAVRAKIDVFFITARKESDAASTEKNLREVGYDTWTKIYYKPAAEPPQSIAAFKTGIRRQLTQDGYDIIANLGDQNSDLTGGYAEKTFKLPNPFYYSN